MKKLLAILLSLSMCLGSILPIFAAEQGFDVDGNREADEGYIKEEEGQEDADARQEQMQNREDEIFRWNHDETMIVYKNKRKQYNTLVQKLMAFDIWENTGDEYVEKVTRGDFAQVIAKLYNFHIQATTQSFADVPPTHEHYNDIEMIRALGIIKGDENGNFQPDAIITYADAVVMLVRICGYEEYAKTLGAYPLNYLMAARRCDIIEKMPEPAPTEDPNKKNEKKTGNTQKELQIESELNRWDVAQILEYLLDAAVAGSEWYSDGSAMVMHTKEGEVTLLNQIRDIKKGTGIVTSVGKQYIDGGREMNEDYVMIDGVEMEKSDSEIVRYLGYRVDFYYKKDGRDINKLIFVEEKSNYNRVVNVDGKDIVSVSGKRIEYYKNEDDKRSSYVTASSHRAILNGFEPGSYDDEDLRGADYITLIDNDNDGSYEVTFIDKYEIFVAKSYSEETGKIYNYYDGQPIIVDFSDDNVVIVDSAGNPSEPNIIKNKSVIAYGTNKDGSKKKFVVTNKTVSGMITKTYDLNDYTDARIMIEEQEYRFSKNTEDIGKDLPKPGQSYTFLMDYKDRIAGIEKNANSALQYGYLISAASTSSFDTEVKLRVYAYVTGMTEYYLADKIEIDGEKGIKNDAVMKKLENVTNALNDKMAALDNQFVKPEIYFNDTLFVRQPIKYTVDAANNITSIDTPFVGEKEDIDKRDTFFGRDTMTLYDDFSARGDGKSPGGLYLRNANVIASYSDHYIGVSGSAKVFVVPSSNDFSVVSDPDNYDRPGVKYFKHFANYPESTPSGQAPNRMEVYNLNKEHTTDFIIYYTDISRKTDFDNQTPLTIITDVVSSIDEEGNPITELKGIEGALEINIPIADNVSLEKQYRGPNGEVITSNLERGDIIRYETNFQGEMIRYVKVFDLDDEDDPRYVIAGNEVGSTIDSQNLNPTMLAVSDGKYAANGHKTSHIGSGRNDASSSDNTQTSSANYNFNAGFRLVYGSVLYNEGSNLVLKADLIDQATGEVLEDQTEICTATSYNFICIDEERDDIYVPTIDEIVSEYNTTEEDATKLILHTSGGKQKMLVLVKRKK